MPAVGKTLTGEVAIVTGASSGIGAATASELARRGASVVLAARRAGRLAEQAREIRRAGGTALAVTADMADPADIALLTQRAADAFGKVDVLVNNAGAFWETALAKSPPADIAALTQVNLLGAILATRAVLPEMLSRRHGTIICVGSLSGRVATEPVYSATKYGLRGFSLALRRQLAGTGVSVSLVSPGRIGTEMTSHVHGPMPGPELVATTIASLIMKPRRELVVPAKHYAIAWLEQSLPLLADLAYRQRHWSPVREVREEETVPWKSLSRAATGCSAVTWCLFCRGVMTPCVCSRCLPRTRAGSKNTVSGPSRAMSACRTRSPQRWTAQRPCCTWPA
jgi:NADP-dependent 3-hydroxy acid dehydrogenase YdfG